VAVGLVLAARGRSLIVVLGTGLGTYLVLAAAVRAVS
jgi:hypothetical protein